MTGCTIFDELTLHRFFDTSTFRHVQVPRDVRDQLFEELETVADSMKFFSSPSKQFSEMKNERNESTSG